MLGQVPLATVARMTASAARGQAAARPRRGRGVKTGYLEVLPRVSAAHPQLVALTHPKAPIAEAFGMLRTNLDFCSLDKPFKSLAVTSAVPSEGKSTVSANLAIAEALAGKRVILVDADLRRPSLYKLFNITTATGFASVLIARDNRAGVIDAALQPTMVPNLLLLPSGALPPNPAELLASRATAEVVRELEGRADLVIFDTPPIGQLADAVALSGQVDGTLAVVRADSTRLSVLTNSLDSIRKVGGNVVGTVLNMVDVKRLSAYYSYAYYYDYEAGHDGQAEAGQTAAAGRTPPGATLSNQQGILVELAGKQRQLLDPGAAGQRGDQQDAGGDVLGLQVERARRGVGRLWTLVEQRRVGVAHDDDGAAQAVALFFGVDDGAEPREAGFGRRIGRAGEGAGPVRGQRADMHEGPATLLAHDWQHGVDTQESAVQVRRHDVAPVPRVQLREGAARHVEPRVVDENIDAPETFHGAFDHALHVGLDRHIAHGYLYTVGRARRFPHQHGRLLQGSLVAPAQRHRRPRAGQRHGRGASDAAARPRHQGDLPR